MLSSVLLKSNTIIVCELILLLCSSSILGYSFRSISFLYYIYILQLSAELTEFPDPPKYLSRNKARFITMQGPEPRMVQDMVLVDSFLMEGTRDPLQGYLTITPWDSLSFPIWGWWKFPYRWFKGDGKTIPTSLGKINYGIREWYGKLTFSMGPISLRGPWTSHWNLTSGSGCLKPTPLRHILVILMCMDFVKR